MDLKLIDDSGKAGNTVAGSDALFAREYNEALIHQLVIAFQANARSGSRAQKSRGEINKSHKKPWQQKGTGRARAGQANSPLWRGGGKIFPNSPDENFSQKIKALGFSGTVLVVTDKVDENVFLSSRNLPTVLVLEAKEVDPVSLIRFENVLLTKAALAQFEEILG